MPHRPNRPSRRRSWHDFNGWEQDPYRTYRGYRPPGLVQRLTIGLLHYLTLALAVALGLLVLAAPLLTDSPGADWAGLVLYLFASDTALRRTTLAAAVGLWVTAVVFFRLPRPEWERPGKYRRAG